MTEVTAAMVKELREKTGAGMMDCKKALAESSGDLEAAVDWLRAKGIAKAAKKASRVAAEGLIGLAVEGRAGALVEVNSETDFVSRNPDFQGMVSAIAKSALTAQGDIERLRAAAYPGGSQTIADKLSEMVATIGENMNVRRSAVVAVEQGAIGSYLHNQVAPGLCKIGVVVAVQSTGNAEKLGGFARQLAMHIAAANPVSLDIDGVPTETLEREKAILAEKNAGKPAQVLQKILDSGIKSFAKEHTLLEQAYVHDGSKSVSQVMKELEGQVGAPVKIARFVRFQLGEGIEKESADFAAEVAKAAKGG